MRRKGPWRYWVDYNNLCTQDPQVKHRPFRLVVPADAYDALERKYQRVKKQLDKLKKGGKS